MSSTGLRCPRCGSDFSENQGICNRCGAILQADGGWAVQKGQVCFECGYQSESPFDRCPECGTPVGIECLRCGHLNHVSDRSCASCGQALLSEAMDSTLPAGPRAQRNFKSGFMLAGVLLAAAFAGFGYLMSRSGTLTERIIEFLVFLVVLAAAAWWLIFSQRDKIKTTPIKRRREGGMVEIFRTSLATSAEYLQEVLRSEGVEAVIMNRHFGSFIPFAMSQGIQVLVPEAQETRAREVMKAYAFSDDDPGGASPGT